MSTVAEIENALQTLPVDEARKVAGCMQHYLDEKWGRQIDADIAAGQCATRKRETKRTK